MPIDSNPTLETNEAKKIAAQVLDEVVSNVTEDEGQKEEKLNPSALSESESEAEEVVPDIKVQGQSALAERFFDCLVPYFLDTLGDVSEKDSLQLARSMQRISGRITDSSGKYRLRNILYNIIASLHNFAIVPNRICPLLEVENLGGVKFSHELVLLSNFAEFIEAFVIRTNKYNVVEGANGEVGSKEKEINPHRDNLLNFSRWAKETCGQASLFEILEEGKQDWSYWASRTFNNARRDVGVAARKELIGNIDLQLVESRLKTKKSKKVRFKDNVAPGEEEKLFSLSGKDKAVGDVSSIVLGKIKARSKVYFEILFRELLAFPDFQDNSTLYAVRDRQLNPIVGIVQVFAECKNDMNRRQLIVKSLEKAQVELANRREVSELAASYVEDLGDEVLASLASKLPEESVEEELSKAVVEQINQPSESDMEREITEEVAVEVANRREVSELAASYVEDLGNEVLASLARKLSEGSVEEELSKVVVEQINQRPESDMEREITEVVAEDGELSQRPLRADEPVVDEGVNQSQEMPTIVESEDVSNNEENYLNKIKEKAQQLDNANKNQTENSQNDLVFSLGELLSGQVFDLLLAIIPSKKQEGFLEEIYTILNDDQEHDHNMKFMKVFYQMLVMIGEIGLTQDEQNQLGNDITKALIEMGFSNNQEKDKGYLFKRAFASDCVNSVIGSKRSRFNNLNKNDDQKKSIEKAVNWLFNEMDEKKDEGQALGFFSQGVSANSCYRDLKKQSNEEGNIGGIAISRSYSRVQRQLRWALPENVTLYKKRRVGLQQRYGLGLVSVLIRLLARIARRKFVGKASNSLVFALLSPQDKQVQALQAGVMVAGA